MLKAENLGKVYHTSVGKRFFKREKITVEAVKNLDLEIREGQIVGLLGINGAGKTTTIKMLSTLLAPTIGDITIDGMDAVKNATEVKKFINMVAGGERMIYWRLTGKENLWYYGQLYGVEEKILKKRMEYLLELVGLTEKQDVPVERYSKGMKQRLQIARGLINDPRYIFMDEPTLGLDAAISKELREYVKQIAYKEGKSILLTSHYMQEVEELCEYIYILDHGTVIAQGTPKELAYLAREHKILCLELQSLTDGLHRDLNRICFSLEKNCSIQLDEKNKAYTITSTKDLSTEIAKVLLQHEVPIKKFYTQEPRLEDTIIKLSKGA